MKNIEDGVGFALWHKGNVITRSDARYNERGLLIHRNTRALIYKPIASDFHRDTEITRELLDRIGDRRTPVVVNPVHYKSVVESRWHGWSEGTGRDFSRGDSRADDGWRGMYTATTQDHARRYLSKDGALLAVSTPGMRAYDLTGIDYSALGFPTPQSSARLVKEILGLDPNKDLMQSCAENQMVLKSGEPGGDTEVIVPYPLANQKCTVSASSELASPCETGRHGLSRPYNGLVR